LVIFFMLILFWSLDVGDLFNAGAFSACPQCFAQRCRRAPPGASIALPAILRASLPNRSCHAIVRRLRDVGGSPPAGNDYRSR
jgi:hypothetical protein